jgi:nucleotide-binding universal stress UspA family protein
MFERVLVPLDGTPQSVIALPVACTFARAYHSQVVLFRVVDTTAKRYDAKYDLERIAGEFASSTVSVTSEVWIGSDVAAQISWAAASLSADLVIMATHGHGGARRMAMGSVAESLVAQSSVPVLVVPIIEAGADRVDANPTAIDTHAPAAALTSTH